MITIVLLVLALFVLQTLIPAGVRYSSQPSLGASLRDALGSRDNPPPVSAVGERATRALHNLLEAMPVFITLALLNLIRAPQSASAWQGAMIFLLARIVYVPAYLSGIPGVRSMAWMVSWVGLIFMLLPLLGS